MDIKVGLKFKIDGAGDTHEIVEVVPKNILDIKSSKLVHVIHGSGSNKGKKSNGSPVDLAVANELIQNGYWVIQ